MYGVLSSSDVVNRHVEEAITEATASIRHRMMGTVSPPSRDDGER